jgi:hypothetical protein
VGSSEETGNGGVLQMNNELFIGGNDHPGYMVTYKPAIYGIYMSDSWFVLENGSIFHTFYREIAAATLHNLYKRHKDITSRIAIIGGDGQPEFLGKEEV